MRKCSQSGFLLGAIIGILFAIEGLAADFAVNSKRGSVSVLLPGQVEWLPLAKKTLPHGALLSVGPASSITLSHRVLVGERSQKLKFEANMVVRLDDELLRSHQFAEYPLARLLSGAKSETNPVKDKPILTLADAFKRYMVSYGRSEALPKRQLDPEPIDVATGQSSEAITLISPADGSILFLHRDEAETSLRWAKHPKLENYLVYLWQEAQNRGAPLAKTKDLSIKINFSKPGSYRLMVTSEDRAIRSATLDIIVRRSLDTQGPRRKFLSSVLQREKLGLEIIQPRADTLIYQNRGESTLLFAWHDTEALGIDEEYQIDLSDAKGKKYSIKSRKNQANASLPSGQYVWTVQRRSRDTAMISKDSGVGQTFTVAPIHESNWTEPLSQALKAPNPLQRVIVIDIDS